MASGYVAIIGKPNVGKSTFLNAILGHKVAIVSPKPQTTRKQNIALYSRKDVTILFIDTPGYHQVHNKLDVFLNSQIKSSLHLADVVLWFIDLTRRIDDEDLNIVQTLKEYQVSNIILTLTKLDVSNSKKIEEYTTKIKALIEINKTIAISAYQQTNFHQLMQLIKPYLTNKNSDLIDLDDNDKFIISEIIREQVIFNTKQELPYATAVVVEKVDYDKIKTLTTINALIYVEKDSQKPIIIGKGGQMIKKIGTIARNELSKIYDGKINLQLLVKVQNDWRNDERFLQTIGYSNKK